MSGHGARHISTRLIPGRLHTAWVRATGQLIGCSEGATLDGEMR